MFAMVWYEGQPLSPSSRRSFRGWFIWKPESRSSPNVHTHYVEVVVVGPDWSPQALAHRGEHRIKQGEILVVVFEDRNGGVLTVLLHSVCEDGCPRHLSEK